MKLITIYAKVIDADHINEIDCGIVSDRSMLRDGSVEGRIKLIPQLHLAVALFLFELTGIDNG